MRVDGDCDVGDRKHGSNNCSDFSLFSFTACCVYSKLFTCKAACICTCVCKPSDIVAALQSLTYHVGSDRTDVHIYVYMLTLL